ncbi:aminotransferase class V-fold PLP-dependent enzyme [Salsuginibacillus kocurii]|uniref:aminotransferase class V-fold PLP-dependent enzyme n=1 Tax=Salsuginibacillus kocurii TaxID=427078 RepID=UPI00039B9A6E|nr:aminotransferase class V-fold PLP-dependent enzyme [Salsuginibacillus kocurii]
MIYLDHAATSFPKAPEVAERVAEAITSYAANPGRGSHKLAKQSAQVVSAARSELAKLFDVPSPERVVFTSSATHALNIAIHTLKLNAGDHVIATTLEHNSVRRPLEDLALRLNVKITWLEPTLNGEILYEQWQEAATEATKAVVTCHGSNVTGTVLNLQPLQLFIENTGLPWVLDASQTAGVLPVHLQKLGASMVACPGHKGLLGPQGTGVLLLGEQVEPIPFLHGGTGMQSEAKQMPEQLPERLEAGTLNTPGIVGLLAGIEEVSRLGLSSIYEHERQLTERIVTAFAEIDGLEVYGPDLESERLGVVAFKMKGVDAQEAALIFDSHYDICLRSGLHCSPLAHGWIKTSPEGLLRASVGPYTTKEEIDTFIRAAIEIYEGLRMS